MQSSQPSLKQSDINDGVNHSLVAIYQELSGSEDLLRHQILANADLLVNKLVTAIESRDVMTIREQVDLLIKRPIKNVLGRVKKTKLTVDSVKKSLIQVNKQGVSQ